MSFDALTPEQWYLLLGVVGLFALISMAAIYDGFKREFPSTNEKLAWLQAAVLVPFLGGLAYFIFGRKRGKKIR